MSRRRKSNPFAKTLETDLIWYVALAAGLYFAYKYIIPKLFGPGTLVGDATSGIASLFPGTSPTVVVQGTVLLPGGGSIPISSLQSNGFNADGSLNMVDSAGNPYTITSAGNGMYQAR